MQIGVRDACVPLAAGQHLFDALDDLGVKSVELLIDAVLSVPSLRLSLGDADVVRGLKQQLALRGIQVCALLLGTDFSGPAAEAHVQWVIRAARIAGELGTPVIRIDAHTPDRSLASQTVRDNVIRCARTILTETADTGVDLGLENHAFLSNDPVFLDAVFDAVADPRLGLTLDTGNFYWFGCPLDELYPLFEKYAPRVKHTHIKSIHFPPDMAHQRRQIGWEYAQYRSPLDEGDIDLSRVVQILRNAGYQRSLCIENESLNKFPEPARLEVIRRDVRALKRTLPVSPPGLPAVFPPRPT
jgi:sugar phosphate isomerase/epimerase